jgi:hypothetical protein
MSWWTGRKTKSEREIECYKKFEEQKPDLEIATSLKMSMKEVQEYRKTWEKNKNEKQTKLYEMFAQDKDFVLISKTFGMTVDEVSSELKNYLNLKDKKEEIIREHDREKDNHGKGKKFSPPYRVTKLTINSMTGKKNTIESFPVDFDSPPKSVREFEDFAREYGDGVYIIVDSENRKVSQLPVSGMGFADPSLNPDNPMFDPDAGMGGDGDGYEAFGAGRRRGRFGGFWGGRGRFGGRGRRGGVDDEAEDMLDMDERKRQVYMRAAEMATRQGRPRDAERLLLRMDPDTIPTEKRGFIDELVETGSDAGKLDILRKVFGGNTPERNEESEQERSMKFATDHLIPSIKENIIEPVMDGISGNLSADDQLKREVMHSRLGPEQGFRTGESGTGWKARGAIRPSKTSPELPPAQRPPASPVAPRIPVDVSPSEGEVEEEYEEEEIIGDVDKPAEDYGQPINAEELKVAPPKKEISLATAPKKLSLEQSWVLNNRVPKFRSMIEGWVAAKNIGNVEAIETCSPQKCAQDDYYLMTKSTYARFIGKKRLLDTYHAAKKGMDGLMGDIAPHVQVQIDTYEETAKIIRKMGVERFKEVWEPPSKMSKRKALRMLGKYMTLKSCWDTFQTTAGKEWLNAYCTELVKCIEGDVMKIEDKKDKIKAAVTPQPTLPPTAPPALPPPPPEPPKKTLPTILPLSKEAPKPPPPPGFTPPPIIASPKPEVKPEPKIEKVPMIKIQVLDESNKKEEIKKIENNLDEILSELEPEEMKED